LAEIPYYHFEIGSFAGVEDVIISATGYTGSGGFELYVKNENAEDVWNQILKSGAPQGIQPIGLAARDTLRLEKGFCLYGMDINDETSPLEAGLGWITKLGHEFNNRDYFLKQKAEGLTKRLVGFELLEKGIPRHDYEIFDDTGTKVGVVTSGTMSPSLGKGIGLAYIDVPHHKTGTELFLEIRKKQIPIKICKIPFL
jgi:aminomethyltransferase